VKFFRVYLIKTIATLFFFAFIQTVGFAQNSDDDSSEQSGIQQGSDEDQNEEENDDTGPVALESVTITARRQSEDLQEVPIAVSAFTPETLKMMIALISSMATGCRYCQAHMANLSTVYKVADNKLQSIWECEQSVLFTPAERAALIFAKHASAVPNSVSDEHFDELKKHFNDTEIVEIVASIALFGYLNRWNDSMATELEQYPSDVAERVIGSSGWEAGKHQ